MSNNSIYVKTHALDVHLEQQNSKLSNSKDNMNWVMFTCDTNNNKSIQREKTASAKRVYSEMLLSHLKCVSLPQKAILGRNSSFSSMLPAIMKRHNHIDKVSYPTMKLKTQIFGTIKHLNCTLSISIYEINKLFAQAEE